MPETEQSQTLGFSIANHILPSVKIFASLGMYVRVCLCAWSSHVITALNFP